MKTGGSSSSASSSSGSFRGLMKNCWTRKSSIKLDQEYDSFAHQFDCLNNIALDALAKREFCASGVIQPKQEEVQSFTYTEADVTRPWRPLHKLSWRRVVIDDRFVWLAVFHADLTKYLESQHKDSFPHGAADCCDGQELEFGIKDAYSSTSSPFSSSSPVVSDCSDSAAAPTARSPNLHGSKKFSVDDKKGLLSQFRWRRVIFSHFFALAPSLNLEEIAYLDSLLNFEKDVRSQRALLASSAHSLAEIMKNESFVFNPENPIRHVVLLVVVLAEVAPILAKMEFDEDLESNEMLGGLARCFTGQFASYKLTVAKVSESDIFQRHYSGGTQVSGISALIAKLMKPDLVVSFGTAGGCPPTTIGGVVLASGCLFLDRTRTSSAGAFSWGIWGGGTVPTPKLVKRLEEFNVKFAPVASQISYAVSQLSMEKINALNVACLDMECASEAQILNQMRTNFIAMKVISNGVYPGEPKRMESEYHDNRDTVSQTATEVLMVLFEFLDGKLLSEL